LIFFHLSNRQVASPFQDHLDEYIKCVKCFEQNRFFLNDRNYYRWSIHLLFENLLYVRHTWFERMGKMKFQHSSIRLTMSYVKYDNWSLFDLLLWKVRFSWYSILLLLIINKVWDVSYMPGTVLNPLLWLSFKAHNKYL
jgi:hypothetical protein